MRSRLVKFLIITAGFAAAVFAVALIISRIPSGYTPPPLPQTNGYTGLVKAAQAMPADATDYATMSEQQLDAVVRSNSLGLQLVRSNLSLKCQVPLIFLLTNFSAHVAELSASKRIAFAFAAEGRLAQMQHRQTDAAKSYLDIIRLGVASSHGGTIIDALVGIAIENVGASELQKSLNTLDQKTCEEAAKELEEIETQRDTWRQVLQQEHYWSSKTFSSFPNMVLRLISFSSTRKAEAKAEQKYNTTTRNIRRSIIDLAVRAYALQKGHPPSSPADLVPAYLKNVPTDPTTGANMALPQ
jgi:hypothetical protein